MAKPVLKFKVNQQSAEVGGKYYGIVEDTAVTPENSILQICEFKKITAFAPEQVLRLVEDVCDGAAQLVARDGQSRQLSSLLKFSPRVRGTFSGVDSRWTNQKLIVGARLLKDIKLDMDPSSFVMSNVADIGTITSAALQVGSTVLSAPDMNSALGTNSINVNGSNLDIWSAEDTFIEVYLLVNRTTGGRTEQVSIPWAEGTLTFSVDGFAPNGFTAHFNAAGAQAEFITISEVFVTYSSSTDEVLGWDLRVKHPTSDRDFKRITIPWSTPLS